MIRCHGDESGPVFPKSRVIIWCVGAVAMTHTRVDHHHCSLDKSAGGTAEGHRGSGGLERRAAAGVGALPTVPELVRAGAVAALVEQSNGPWGHVGGCALSLLTPLLEQKTPHHSPSLLITDISEIMVM